MTNFKLLAALTDVLTTVAAAATTTTTAAAAAAATITFSPTRVQPFDLTAASWPKTQVQNLNAATSLYRNDTSTSSGSSSSSQAAASFSSAAASSSSFSFISAVSQQQEELTPLLYEALLATAAATGTTTTTAATAAATAVSTPTTTATLFTTSTLYATTNSSAATAVANVNAAAVALLQMNSLPSPLPSSSSFPSLPPHASVAPLGSVDSYFVGMAWPQALIVAIFLLLILVTVVGNTLVILAVLTTRRLRTVTNCFVMNLAITDWLVGTCVMPPSVILYIVGTWRFGWILCDIWISLDILLCTGSILSLCAISVDRYLAVTQPLTYSKKRRSKRLALFMIFIVWVTALSITCPPYLGWYEPGRRQQDNVVCRYNQNKGYVVFSAMGSFFIPLAVMLYVYLKIGYVLTSRRQRIVRDANSERTADHEIDCDNFLSESEHFQCATPKFPSFKTRWGSGGNHSNGNVGGGSSKNNSLKCSKCQKNYIDTGGGASGGSKSGSLQHQASFYELVEISRLSSLIHCSAMSCKYGGPCMHATPVGVVGNGADSRASTLPLQALHFAESRTSFSETCLASGGTSMAATSQSGKFGPGQHQHVHHHAPHQPHRVAMRISTTKRDTKTAKTLTIVMGGFIACWLPFFIYYLLIPFLPRAAVLEGLMSFLTWVGWVNCAINPFIYAFYNPDFRTAFWRLTCRRICKQKPPPNHMAMFRG